MLTTVLCEYPGWADRTDKEILRRLRLIEADGNLLHGFAPTTPPKIKKPLILLIKPILEALDMTLVSQHNA